MDKSKALNDILTASSIEDMYAVAEWSIAASDRHDDDEEKFYSGLLYIIAKNFCEKKGIRDTYQMQYERVRQWRQSKVFYAGLGITKNK